MLLFYYFVVMTCSKCLMMRGLTDTCGKQEGIWEATTCAKFIGGYEQYKFLLNDIQFLGGIWLAFKYCIFLIIQVN